MEVSITKISQNGQIVIPSEVRQSARIGPSTKFLVFNKGGDIILKQIKKQQLDKMAELIMKIEKSEDQIKSGKNTKANTSMSDKDIDSLLMA
ncbi:MAG: AbrB/MazE/SpoVT family DNA-binding domain-containing protein [Nanoarchaeota archaeon]